MGGKGVQAAASKEGKQEAQEVLEKSLQPAWQEIIDVGWDIYGVGWLITFPFLLFLLYLDWTEKGITLPFIGKIKVVKLGIIQKVDAWFQITLAFLSYGIILALFILIYEIFSGKITGIIFDDLVRSLLGMLGFQ